MTVARDYNNKCNEEYYFFNSFKHSKFLQFIFWEFWDVESEFGVEIYNVWNNFEVLSPPF